MISFRLIDKSFDGKHLNFTQFWSFSIEEAVKLCQLTKTKIDLSRKLLEGATFYSKANSLNFF